MDRILTLLLFGCICLSSPAKDPDAKLVHQETDVSVKNGRLLKTISYEIQINNRDGENFTNISIPYSRLVKISKIEAFIKDTNDIIIKKLQKGDIKDKSAISDYSLYEDNFVKEFTLKHNIYPYRIYYSYEVQENEFLFLDYWVPVLDWKTPTLTAELNVEVPKGFRLSSRARFSDTCMIDSTDLTVRYSWRASYRNIIEPETSSPELSTMMPSVIVVPMTFNYDQPGSMASWLNFGEWECMLNKNLSDLPESEKYIILNKIEGIKDTREKIRILYNYLQDHTRYINITIETGGLKPFPASYVSENKYGDCKALTNYFKSVLEVAGIKSYYTDVKAGDHIVEVDKSFPSQQFNHVFLCIPLQKDTLWLDCTSKKAFGYYGTFTQGRDVFIVGDGISHMAKTPQLSGEEVKESRKAVLRQNIQNQTIGDFINIYRGERYEYFFDLLNSFGDADRRQYLRTHVIRNGFELIDFNLRVPCRDSAKIELKYSARSTKVYKEYGNDLIIGVLPFSIPRFEDPKNRKLPVQLDYPIFKTDSLEYEIPVEFKTPDKLTNDSVSSEFGRYYVAETVKGNKVNVVKSFLL